jgi:two-component system, LytTR family, response regulator
MLKCLILDDEPLAISLLQNYVSQTPELELICATTKVFEALPFAQQGKVDLIFLDIQMPELSGIQFMKILNGSRPIIVTSAYEQYAIQAFDHAVVDYLLKPFSYDRFLVAVQRAKERRTPISSTTKPKHLFIRSEHRMLKVDHSDIFYLEALRDYVAVHCLDGKILTLQPLRSFEELLPENQFMRVHRSYIVAVDKISKLEKSKISIRDIMIPIGEKYLGKLKEKIFSG